MNTTHVLSCGDCPHYTPDCPSGTSNGRPVPLIPQSCTHPDTASGIAHPFLNGPSVMPPQCPLITNHTVYRAVRREIPK